MRTHTFIHHIHTLRRPNSDLSFFVRLSKIEWCSLLLRFKGKKISQAQLQMPKFAFRRWVFSHTSILKKDLCIDLSNGSFKWANRCKHRSGPFAHLRNRSDCAKDQFCKYGNGLFCMWSICTLHKWLVCAQVARFRKCANDQQFFKHHQLLYGTINCHVPRID